MGGSGAHQCAFMYYSLTHLKFVFFNMGLSNQLMTQLTIAAKVSHNQQLTIAAKVSQTMHLHESIIALCMMDTKDAAKFIKNACMCCIFEFTLSAWNFDNRAYIIAALNCCINLSCVRSLLQLRCCKLQSPNCRLCTNYLLQCCAAAKLN